MYGNSNKPPNTKITFLGEWVIYKSLNEYFSVTIRS